MLGEVRVDRVTVIGLALLLMPLLTMLHEIGGHAAMCLAVGHRVTELGAFYVECDAVRGSAAMRLVALAGPGIDLAAGALVLALWPRLRGDFSRLVALYVWLCLLFDGTGYFLFSGVAGIGDLGPSGEGGLAPLPWPALWRVGFALGGGAAYFALVRLGMKQVAAMLGQGAVTMAARRTVAHWFYGTICVAAVLASIPNPVGLFITLASAAAASIGGKAGFISIGYATRDVGNAKPFVIERSWGLLVAGVAASTAFAVVLGPTLRFG
ncbi:MAG: hypothetical protein KGN34_18900 [Sphingomonadales bacterium]|nr:hypothetical protein [Sphingomonadales bacterium]